MCFLQQEAIRQSIHTGPKSLNRGIESYHNLNNTIMVSKKDWLEETLEREGIEVLIYNGNLDVIVNVAGTNRLVNSLRWSGQGEFAKSERKSFWVWNPETGRGELGNKMFLRILEMFIEYFYHATGIIVNSFEFIFQLDTQTKVGD